MTQHRRVYIHDVLIGTGRDAVVSAIAWADHHANGLPVGTCPRCQRGLRPGAPHEVGRTVWYPAECSGAGCDYETTMHGPRPPKKGAAA